MTIQISPTKKVNIIIMANGLISAAYVQFGKGYEDVLQRKTFSTLRGAEKWANTLIK